MNKKLVFQIMAKMMCTEGALLAIPALVSLIYAEWRSAVSYAIICLATVLIFYPAARIKTENKDIFAKEGFVIVGSAWILWSLVGALPLFISGEIPNYIDAFFETVSGFTTTGATILSDVEALSHGSLLWRSLTHWIGGMGVLVLVMVVLPVSDDRSSYLMQAEMPGPTFGKLVPKGRAMATILYKIYCVLTLILALLLLIGGMDIFDSFVHAFSTAGTGGFSSKNASIAFYDSVYIETVITVFMLLFGINFTLFYLLLAKRFLDVWKNKEWKIFIGIVAVATVLLTLSIKSLYGSYATAFRYSIFQIAAIISTTGFGLSDYNQWPEFSKIIILTVMIIGGCAGSTGGGIKVSRVVIMFKSFGREIKRMLHPRSYNLIKVDGKTVDESAVAGVGIYLIIYVISLCLGVLLVSINGYDFATTFSSVLTCISNVGPGLSLAGPVENFGFFSNYSKIVLSFIMLLGRLEFWPLIILFAPSTWLRKNR